MLVSEEVPGVPGHGGLPEVPPEEQHHVVIVSSRVVNESVDESGGPSNAVPDAPIVSQDP